MNLYQFYVYSNTGYRKEEVHLFTQKTITDKELSQLENLKFSEAREFCKYHYKAQLLTGHIEE